MRTNDRVTGIVIREAKLLLIHRFKQGAEYYVFPGGGVEEGETWEDALAREMQEETGLALVSYRYLYQSKDAQTQIIFYECVLAPGEPQLGGPELAAQSEDNQYLFEWIAVSQAPELPGLYPKPDAARLLALLVP